MDDYLLLIDGSSLLTTQFFGNLPTEILFAKTEEEKEKYFYKIMQTSQGVYTNAIFGFMRTLMKIMKDQRPSHLAVAWDVSRNTFRREMYADYKGNRSETLKPLGEQFELCQNALRRMGVQQFYDERYEADDFCGTLSRKFEGEIPVRIITKDNDYLQLVTERTNLWLMHATAKKTDELYAKYKIAKDGTVADRCFPFNPERVVSEFGVEPSSIADLKGLQGDTSDNIKGVPGVGPATAVSLIAHYKTVEKLYEAMDGLDEKELKALAVSWKDIGVTRSPINNLLKIDESELVGRQAAFLSKKLATIKCDIDLGGLTLDDLGARIDSAEAQKVFDEFEFKSMKADFGTADVPESSFTYRTISEMLEAEEYVSAIINDIQDNPDKPQRTMGFALLSADGRTCGLALSGISDTAESGACAKIDATTESDTVLILSEGFITEEYLADIVTRLDDAGVRLAGFDIKNIVKKFRCKGYMNAFDVSVAEYVINPILGDYSASKIASDELGMRGLPSGDAQKDAAVTAYAAFRACDVLCVKLGETGMDKVFEDIEMPLVYTLAGMEREGVLLRKDELTKFGEALKVDIVRLEKEIYEEVGEEFNINSPKQLGVILFEKLGLPYGKKTKTGYSTSADILEKLSDKSPVVSKILEYRKLTKLNSTYAEGLYDYIDADGRIRTTFNQTVTATGRLSSTEPNLQNIPIRTELGRNLRKVFVAGEGNILVDADYSQIELRILAALSGDEKLIDAYRTAKDIHQATASAVFKIPYDEVTPELRRRAKAVNFGIVYGISSFGLSNDLDIPMGEAKDYIDEYFATYPGIKTFLDRMVKEAIDFGYATTAFGRRRPIPELKSENYMQRQFGERVAMNSPIQGTAADIIKLAMIRVDTRLRQELPEAKLILQVHDELLVEAPKQCEEAVRRILVEEMQHAAELGVTLEVGIESGSNWYEAH